MGCFLVLCALKNERHISSYLLHLDEVLFLHLHERFYLRNSPQRNYVHLPMSWNKANSCVHWINRFHLHLLFILITFIC